MKRSVFIAVIACITFVMPMTVNAAEAYAALSNDNTTLTFYYDNEKSSRNGMDIGPFEESEQSGWYDFRKNIVTVIIDDSFAQCTDLQSTSHWFHGLSKITSIIGIENLKTSNVTDMSGMFMNCRSLTSVDVRNFDTRNVKDMNGMFCNCESLQFIDLSNFDTRNVEDMSSMFEECELETIDLSSFNTEKVTTMASMFENCKTPKKIDVSSFNTSNVTDMSKMFESCFALKVLDLSSFNTSNVTNMRSMFSEDSELATIYVSDKWSTAKVENGKGVFSKCNSIVGGSGTTWDENHTDYTYAHIDGGASNPGYLTLKTGDIPDINTDKVEAYAALSNENTTLTFYYDDKKSSRDGMDIGPFENKKDRGWHEYSNEITTVVFDDSFTQMIDLTSTAYWFKGFGELTTISGLENLNTYKVIDMSSMFDDCSSLNMIDLSSFNTENVENMQGMFIECESLTTLDLRSFNTSRVKNMSMMFAGCVNLNNPYLKTFNTENVTEMWSMFENCEKLTELDISNFNTSNVIDMRYMFADCYCLPELDLSNFNTSNVTNMNCLFQGSKTLKTVYVSDEWNTAKVEKGERVFNDCYNIIGGKGTTYDENHTDHTYAHIDGGASNPGYLTYYKDMPSKQEGDVTGDGTVSATDIVELINYIIGNLSNTIDEKAADVNGDGVVNIADIVQVIYFIMRTQ